MKQGIHPAVATVIIVVVVAVVALVIYKGAGPRTDGPSHPIDMGKMMGKGKMAPPAGPGRGNPMGGQPARGGANQ